MINNRVRASIRRANRIKIMAVALALGTAFTGASTAAANPITHPADQRLDHHGGPGGGQHGFPASNICPPNAAAISFSDALDKKVVDGATIGGLSDIAYDSHTRSYVSSVDDNGTDPSRLWFYRNLSDPTVIGPPLVLKDPNGTPYNGETADNEGLAVLPNGDFVVSSEVEPSVRIFSRDGNQLASLPVPARFAVEPAGQSTDNATFEGLTIGDGGRQIVVSMEGTLSGDTGGTGTGDFRRILVYNFGRHGYQLTTQIGYKVDPGNRIPEIQEYAPGKLLVMEAAFTAAAGNTIELYSIDFSHAPDVSNVADLSTEPNLVVSKHLVSDVTKCPSLGAMAKETQTNPLMDNFEGMVTRPIGHSLYAVSLISDDNFSATQTTRVLNLVAKLPDAPHRWFR